MGVNTIAQQLLRSEAIASSQIESIDVPGHRALASAAAGNEHKPGAQLVLANIEAVRWVYDWAASSSDPFSLEVICEIHRRGSRPPIAISPPTPDRSGRARTGSAAVTPVRDDPPVR